MEIEEGKGAVEPSNSQLLISWIWIMMNAIVLTMVLFVFTHEWDLSI